MYSDAPGGVETNRVGSSIQSGTGSITLVSQNEIYLGGSTIRTTGTNGGSVSLTSTGSSIKLYSDYIGETSALIPAAIQTAGGDITLNVYQDGLEQAIALNGATITSTTGDIRFISGGSGIGIGYGSLSSGTIIQSGSGNIYFAAPNRISLYGASLNSTNGGSISLYSSGGFYSSLSIASSLIQTTGTGGVNLSTIQKNGESSPDSRIEVWDGSTLRTEQGNIILEAMNRGLGSASLYASGSTFSTISGNISLTAQNTDPLNLSSLYLGGVTLQSSAGGSIAASALGSTLVQLVLFNSSMLTTSGNIFLNMQGGTAFGSQQEAFDNWYQTLCIAGSSIISESGAVTLNSGSHILIDPPILETTASVITSTNGSVSMTAAATNGIYQGTVAIPNSN
jgi:hypothetical protein